MSELKRIIILGGGFGGVYTAMELDKQLSNTGDIEIILVNRENFLLFTPMLHEVAASDLDATHIVNPIHKLLKKTTFFCGDVENIDLKSREVTLSHGISFHSHTLTFDALVLSLGSVTHFFGLPGLEEHAFTMRTLGDALSLRNHVIGLLEEANFECCADIREKLLTFVVAGGGFAGVETIAGLQDFVEHVIPVYKNLSMKDVKFILVHSGKTILPELSTKLGEYAGQLLTKRGVEIRYGCRVAGYGDKVVLLNDNCEFEACTLVWTAGNAPHPILNQLPFTKENNRILTQETLSIPNYKGIWAVGDCAAIPDGNTGKFHPPTAQHAIRQGKVCARNIVSYLNGKEQRKFKFKTLGQLASLGRRSGVAQVFGFRFSGLIAWLMWRTIYLMKLPRFEKKVRVALDWTLDLIFSKDNVQLPTIKSVQLRESDAKHEAHEIKDTQVAMQVH